MGDEQALRSQKMKVDCLLDSRYSRTNSNSRVASSACSNRFLANGTFEGGVILHRIEDPDNVTLAGEFSLTNSVDGISNHVSIARDDSELVVASNDCHIRYLDLATARKTPHLLPFAVNCLATNPHNPNEFVVAADDVYNYVLDRRTLGSRGLLSCIKFSGHLDYGFACDWSPQNENLLVSGNQDGTVRLWDRRFPEEAVHSWGSALGSAAFDIECLLVGGPVRNCKFSHSGNHVIWAESLDHVGVLKVSDLELPTPDGVHSRVQSIDFIGKCIGLNLCPSDSHGAEQLVIGINDCPLGGILTYSLELAQKPLDFDFVF